MEKFICKYCGKECKNKNSLAQHEIRCKENPNRLHFISNFIKYNEDLRNGNKVSWCKGLTKETSNIIKNRGISLSENWKQGKNNIGWTKGLTKETDERILKYSNLTSNTVSNKVINDIWHNCRSKKYYYDNISFDSIWEVYFYKYIKSLNIEINRCRDKFQYEYNGLHNYIPDFYIPKYDLYIEIKGYPTKKDISKWNQFDNNLNIYFGHNLKDLGISELLDYKELPNRIIKYENSIPNKFKQRIKF